MHVSAAVGEWRYTKCVYRYRVRVMPVKRFSFAACVLVALASPAMPVWADAAPADDAVYRALGGSEGLKVIVDDFLALVLADERIKTQFADADMPHLAMRLNEQLCMLAGGPCRYGGKDMALIHADLHITDAQFNALAEDLQMAMERHGVPSRAQNKLLARLAPMEKVIVTK